MHVAVVGDADGRHAQFLGALDQIRQANRGEGVFANRQSGRLQGPGPACQ